MPTEVAARSGRILEKLKQKLGDVTLAPAMELIGFRLTEEGESFATLELKINFLKPIWTAKLVAKGRVAKGGRTIGLVECDVLDEQGKLVARASSTCMTLRGQEATGR